MSVPKRFSLVLAVAVLAAGLTARREISDRGLWSVKTPAPAAAGSSRVPALPSARSSQASEAPSQSETEDIRDAANEPEGSATRSHGFDPRAYDLPPDGNSWSVVKAVGPAKKVVTVYREYAPGEIRRIDPKTGAPVGRPSGKAISGTRDRASASPVNRPGAVNAAAAERSSVVLKKPAAVAAARGAPVREDHPASRSASLPSTSHAPARTASAEIGKAVPHAEEKRAVHKNTPEKKFHPVLLSHLLGKDAIRPPKKDLKIPDFKALESRTPDRSEDGSPIDPEPPAPSAVEGLRPPDARSFEEARGAKNGFHWHGEEDTHYYHNGNAWGRWDGKNWSWLQKSGSDWFVEAHDADAAAPAVLVWHASHWWWKANGVWFLLHEGEAWGYRYFSELRSEGLVNPRTGAQMVYSADGGKVAVITPGRGATLYDAESGQEVRRWGEEEMPKKAKPKVPASLSFHPD